MSPITLKLASPQMIPSFSRWPSPPPCLCGQCWAALWLYPAWCLWPTRRHPPPPTAAMPCCPFPGSNGAFWLTAERQRSWWPVATGWESARPSKTEPRCSIMPTPPPTLPCGWRAWGRTTPAFTAARCSRAWRTLTMWLRSRSKVR